MLNIVNIKYLEYLKLAMLENLWPTRCCICDTPGYLLCPNCESRLPFIDQFSSCAKCGEPYAVKQCCNCTTAILNNNNDNIGIKQCKSAVVLNKETGRIISLYKDAGERRLVGVIAYFMSKIIPVYCFNENYILTYIPSSESSFNKRGFDHCKNLVIELSKRTNINYIEIFDRPKSIDQRNLTRQQRDKNMQNMFSIKKDNLKNIKNRINNLIIIDDVFTTGSTLNAAAKVLNKYNLKSIYALTFARTF